MKAIILGGVVIACLIGSACNFVLEQPIWILWDQPDFRAAPQSLQQSQHKIKIHNRPPFHIKTSNKITRKPTTVANNTNTSTYMRLGVHRIWHPGSSIPLEVRLKPMDFKRTYVVVIAKTVPNINNISLTKRASGYNSVSNVASQKKRYSSHGFPNSSFHTYTLPSKYLPKEPRYMFVSVFVKISHHTRITSEVESKLKTYTLIITIGFCAFSSEREIYASGLCRSEQAGGKKEYLCLCGLHKLITRRKTNVTQSKSTTLVMQKPKSTVTAHPTKPFSKQALIDLVGHDYKKRYPKSSSKQLFFAMPLLRETRNCSMARRSFLQRLLQRTYPIDDRSTAELLASQILHAQNVLNNRTFYWTCNAFSAVDEERVVQEKTELRSLSLQRLQQILVRFYQATPLVAKGAVLAVRGPPDEINRTVLEKALISFQKTIKVLEVLKAPEALSEIPNIIRSVMQGTSTLLSLLSAPNEKVECFFANQTLSVLKETTMYIMERSVNFQGPHSYKNPMDDEATYSDGVLSLWSYRINVSDFKTKEKFYVRPRAMLLYDNNLYGTSKQLSIAVITYKNHPYRCIPYWLSRMWKPPTTDVIQVMVRDFNSGLSVKSQSPSERLGAAAERYRIQVAFAAQQMEETVAKQEYMMTSETIHVIHFVVRIGEGTIMLHIQPEFIKYHFITRFIRASEKATFLQKDDSDVVILHPLASRILINVKEAMISDGDEVVFLIAPLIKKTVTRLQYANMRYSYWHGDHLRVWFSYTVSQWICMMDAGGNNSKNTIPCYVANVSYVGQLICACSGVQGTFTTNQISVKTWHTLRYLPNDTLIDGGIKKSDTFFLVEYLIPIFLAALWVDFLVLFYWTMRIVEIDEQMGATIYAPENKAENQDSYLCVFYTSYVQYAETTAKIQIELHGTEGTSGKFTLRDPAYNPYFLLSGSINSVVFMVPKSLGNIIVLSISSNSEGTRPSWHLKKCEVFHETGRNEKFTFVVDKWLRFNEQDHVDLLPFVGHGKFKVLYQMAFPRTLRVCHLFGSIFAWPSRSTYSRLQRLVTVLFLGVVTMFSVMAFQGLQPDRDHELQYTEEAIIGLKVSLIVFFLGIFLQFLFSFSKQQMPERIKLLKEDEQSGKARMSKMTTATKYATYVRNPELKVAFEIPEMRGGDDNQAQKERHDSMAEERRDIGILPSFCLYIALLFAMVLAVVLSAIIVPFGIQYGYTNNLSWIRSLVVAILANNLGFDIVKTLLVTFITAKQ